MAEKIFLEVRFKDGDRVKLKSGGPLMTVSNVSNDKIECSWFFEGNIRHDHFNPEALKIFVAKKRIASAAV
jgi:uncharacterized protein YodC (DUF2158 family)